jgi:hypothetical protein
MVQGLGRSDAQAGVGREAPIQQVKYLAFVRVCACVRHHSQCEWEYQITKSAGVLLWCGNSGGWRGKGGTHLRRKVVDVLVGGEGEAQGAPIHLGPRLWK